MALAARDTISGQEGTAFLKIGEERHEMFYIKSLEATVEKSKVEVKTLGSRATQHRANGWSGSGTMTIYYTTTRFRRMMYEYVQSGVDAYFDVVVTNRDPGSSIGSQTVTLNNVNLDSVIIAKLDTEADVLDEEVAFTFDGFDIGHDFDAPTTV